jgi:hypothetical protein
VKDTSAWMRRVLVSQGLYEYEKEIADQESSQLFSFMQTVISFQMMLLALTSKVTACLVEDKKFFFILLSVKIGVRLHRGDKNFQKEKLRCGKDRRMLLRCDAAPTRAKKYLHY